MSGEPAEDWREWAEDAPLAPTCDTATRFGCKVVHEGQGLRGCSLGLSFTTRFVRAEGILARVRIVRGSKDWYAHNLDCHWTAAVVLRGLFEEGEVKLHRNRGAWGLKWGHRDTFTGGELNSGARGVGKDSYSTPYAIQVGVRPIKGAPDGGKEAFVVMPEGATQVLGLLPHGAHELAIAVATNDADCELKIESIKIPVTACLISHHKDHKGPRDEARTRTEPSPLPTLSDASATTFEPPAAMFEIISSWANRYGAGRRWVNEDINVNDPRRMPDAGWLALPKEVRLSMGRVAACVQLTLTPGETRIDSEAFKDFHCIHTVIVPASIEYIADGAFKGCIGLVDLQFQGGGLRWIGAEAFSGCQGLRHIAIPEGTTTIHPRAFEFCSGLRTVTLPSTLTALGSTQVFQNCTMLKEIKVVGAAVAAALTNAPMKRKHKIHNFHMCPEIHNFHMCPDAMVMLPPITVRTLSGDCGTLAGLSLPAWPEIDRGTERQRSMDPRGGYMGVLDGPATPAAPPLLDDLNAFLSAQNPGTDIANPLSYELVAAKVGSDDVNVPISPKLRGAAGAAGLRQMWKGELDLGKFFAIFLPDEDADAAVAEAAPFLAAAKAAAAATAKETEAAIAKAEAEAKVAAKARAAADKANDAREVAGNLFAAAARGELDRVERLLCWEEADPNVTGQHVNLGTCTAVALATAGGHLNVVRLLLDRGAEVNTATSIGRTPVGIASFINHLELVQLLLDRGADPNTDRSYQGRTTLYFASEKGHLELAQQLLDRGADPNTADNEGWSAVMVASEIGCLELARLLLDRGANPNAASSGDCDDKGFTATLVACDRGHLDVVELLLDRGADLHAVTGLGMTAVMFASSGGHLEVARLLLDRGADPNAADHQGMTAVTMACSKAHLEMVRLLLDRGADVNAANHQGMTAMMAVAGAVPMVACELDGDLGSLTEPTLSRLKQGFLHRLETAGLVGPFDQASVVVRLSPSLPATATDPATFMAEAFCTPGSGITIADAHAIAAAIEADLPNLRNAFGNVFVTPDGRYLMDHPILKASAGHAVLPATMAPTPSPSTGPSFSPAVAGAAPMVAVSLEGDLGSMTEPELAALKQGFLDRLEAAGSVGPFDRASIVVGLSPSLPATDPATFMAEASFSPGSGITIADAHAIAAAIEAGSNGPDHFVTPDGGTTQYPVSSMRTAMSKRVTGETIASRQSAGVIRGVVRLLLDRGADVNAIDAAGKTADMYASKSGHRTVAKMLLDRANEEKVAAAAENAGMSMAGLKSRAESLGVTDPVGNKSKKRTSARAVKSASAAVATKQAKLSHGDGN